MLKSNKGAVNLTILIVSIVVAVLIIGTVAGIIIWKVLEKPERRSRDDNGLKDCGVSDIFLNPTHMDMFNADFSEDDVLVCMGKNIKNNCRDSTSVVKTDDFDMTFKVSGKSRSDCKIRIEVDVDAELIYVECPLLGLISLPSINSDYKKFEEKFSQGHGNYAAGLLIMVESVANADWDIGRDVLGCTGNFD